MKIHSYDTSEDEVSKEKSHFEKYSTFLISVMAYTKNVRLRKIHRFMRVFNAFFKKFPFQVTFEFSKKKACIETLKNMFFRSLNFD